MFELLFLLAIVVIGLIQGLLWISGLPCAPTIAVAAACIPLAGGWLYHYLESRPEHAFVGRRQPPPVPPERATWAISRRRLRLGLLGAFLVGLATAPPALLWPARWSLAPDSVTGWLSGAVAIAALSTLAGGGLFYLVASQRLDPMLPNPVGFLRRWAYRVSDNPEFLGESSPDRERKERAIY